MYILTIRPLRKQPTPIPLPSRSIHLSAQNPTVKITDEEYDSPNVKARIRLKHISAAHSGEEFTVPETALSRELKAKHISMERAKSRARGETL